MNENKRLLSLDALRGFDMFWIIGWGGIWHELAKLTDWRFFNWWAIQMTHCEWNGFHFYDFIFPLFLFIAGISFPFSLEKSLQKGITKKALYFKIIKRALILVFLGFVYNGLLKFDFASQRYAGVLVRIGLSWGFAALIFINTKRTGQILWCAGLLIFYWLVLTFVQAPDFPDASRFSPEGNFACYIDRTFLPGKMNCALYDLCGLFGIIPSIATAMLGMLTGVFVKTSKEGLSQMRKVGYMTLAGIGLVLLGLLWNLVFPINKPLWSSSYVCVAGGLSLLLFALFYWIVDVRGYRRWTLFFTVIGLNSITIYMAQAMINFKFTANFIFGGLIGLFPENWTQFLNGISLIAICWLFLYFLYKQKIFIKI